MTKPPLILIGGPTASGKSARALEAARRMNGVIINADAMQVYAGLPLLTAQPEAEDKRAAPHELYEVYDPAERSSAGKWLALAEAALRRCAEAGRTPILVGGTGLYFKALTDGLAAIPPIPDAVRAEVQALYEHMGEAAFRSRLATLDPSSAARIKPNDRQRLIRAFEVAQHTGQPLGYWQNGAGQAQDGAGPVSAFAVRRILLLPPREELYAACDRRFERMMERGALEEVRALLDRSLDPDLPAMKILGVRELAAYLRGEVSRADAVAQAQQATRNYAKRQMTWFRNQWREDGGDYSVSSTPTTAS